ncbi:hypothetical protein HDE_12822 [Halotydeus destructor]|nr:hypothetical protein HDE_12822 [Halotydeus destructor]
MSANQACLSCLCRDAVKKVLYFAPYIWDVLHLTATSRRFHSEAEQHLETLQYLDIRLPYRLHQPEAVAINEGIKSLIMSRIGDQLIEVKILKPNYWMGEIDFFRRLKMVSEGVKLWMDENENSALSNLMREVAIKDCTIRMQDYVRQEKCSSVLDDLEPIVESNMNLFRAIKQDLSTVETLDFKLDHRERFGPITDMSLFQSLRVVKLSVPDARYCFSIQQVPSLIWLLDNAKNPVKIRFGYFHFLDCPLLFVGFQNYLSRLSVDWNVDLNVSPSPFNVASYVALDVVVGEFVGQDTDALISAICRTKTIDMEEFDLDEAKGLICHRSHDIQNLKLKLQLIDDQSIAELFRCIIENCHNLKQLSLKVFGNLDDHLVGLVEATGGSLEHIDFTYDKKTSRDIISAIVSHCPNLRTLKLKGKGFPYTWLKSFYQTFRQMPQLDVVSFSNWYSRGTEQALAFMYCNDKMALESGARSPSEDSDNYPPRLTVNDMLSRMLLEGHPNVVEYKI